MALQDLYKLFLVVLLFESGFGIKCYVGTNLAKNNITAVSCDAMFNQCATVTMIMKAGGNEMTAIQKTCFSDSIKCNRPCTSAEKNVPGFQSCYANCCSENLCNSAIGYLGNWKIIGLLLSFVYVASKVM